MPNYDHIKAVLQPNRPHIHGTATLVDGEWRMAYMAEKITPEAYVARLNLERDKDDAEFVVVSLDEAVEMTGRVQHAWYCKPWAEVSLDDWTEALEVLPPLDWRTVDGVMFFRCSEFTSGSITGTYARVGDRCFYAQREVSDKYEALALEVGAVLSAESGSVGGGA